MFKIGDRIVYPMHGAGVIVSIEEREFLGEMRRYYIVQLPIRDMQVMIPADNIDEIGVRDVISKEEAEKVIGMLSDADIDFNANWNKRYRENMDKLKSGNIFDVAEVVKSLMIREKQKGLSTGERKMLGSAKQILISELVLAENLCQEEIESIIDGCIKL